MIRPRTFPRKRRPGRGSRVTRRIRPGATRLDLHHAIWACFANARTDEEKRADQEQAQEAVFRPKSWGGDFSTTVEYIRRYYDEHPAA